MGIRMVKDRRSIGITVQNILPPGEPYRMKDAIFPNRHTINPDGRVQNIPGNFTGSIRAASVEMQYTRIAKGGTAPSFIILTSFLQVSAPGMNTRVPGMYTVAVYTKRLGYSVIVGICSRYVLRHSLKPDQRAML